MEDDNKDEQEDNTNPSYSWTDDKHHSSIGNDPQQCCPPREVTEGWPVWRDWRMQFSGYLSKLVSIEKVVFIILTSKASQVSNNRILIMCIYISYISVNFALSTLASYHTS